MIPINSFLTQQQAAPAISEQAEDNEARIANLNSRFIDQFDPNDSQPSELTPLHPDDMNLKQRK